MDWWCLWRLGGTFSSSFMVLANNFCAPVYVIRYWIDALCSPMDLSSKRSRIDTIYGSGLIGFVILTSTRFYRGCVDSQRGNQIGYAFVGRITATNNVTNFLSNSNPHRLLSIAQYILQTINSSANSFRIPPDISMSG